MGCRRRICPQPIYLFSEKSELKLEDLTESRERALNAFIINPIMRHQAETAWSYRPDLNLVFQQPLRDFRAGRGERVIQAGEDHIGWRVFPIQL